MLCPILPPNVASLKGPSPGAKKARIPRTAKARLMPPRNQFHFFARAKKRLLAITQFFIETKKPLFTITKIITASATNSMTGPIPNNSRMLFPALVAQATKGGTNTYSKIIITTIKISLRPTGEAMKLKNRFHAGRLSFAFRPGLDLLLALDTELCP